jgi:hypothetical protein
MPILDAVIKNFAHFCLSSYQVSSHFNIYPSIIVLTKLDVLKWPYRVETTAQLQSGQMWNFIGQVPIEVQLSLVWQQPPLQVKLYEYQPRGDHAAYAIKFNLDKENDRYVKARKQAVPLTLSTEDWATDDLTPYENWLNRIIDERERLEKFGRTCYSGFNEKFLQQLFEIFMQYKSTDKKEV